MDSPLQPERWDSWTLCQVTVTISVVTGTCLSNGCCQRSSLGAVSFPPASAPSPSPLGAQEITHPHSQGKHLSQERNCPAGTSAWLQFTLHVSVIPCPSALHPAWSLL